MKIITRYIARRVLRGILLAFVIVTGIIMLVDFVEATRNFDDGSISLLKIAGLTALKIPQLIEETIPFVVLFGVMGALHGLNKRSEIIVLRASGLSAWRFLRPAVFVSAVIGVLWALLFNPLAARSMEKYHDIVRSASTQTAQQSSNEKTEDIWLREGSDKGQVVIHGTLPQMDAQTARGVTLRDVTFYYYDVKPDTAELTQSGETAFNRRIDAKTATLLPSGYWQLHGLVKNTHRQVPERQALQRDISASIPTSVTMEDLREHKSAGRKAPFWSLPSEISRADKAGFSTVGLRMQWYKLLSLPLTLIALTVIAAAVSMSNVRSGGALRLMLAGGAVGFGVYFFNTLMGAFGEAQTLPILTAAWAVPVLVLLLGIAYLARLEDG